jgi:hypothetical protein
MAIEFLWRFTRRADHDGAIRTLRIDGTRGKGWAI